MFWTILSAFLLVWVSAAAEPGLVLRFPDSSSQSTADANAGSPDAGSAVIPFPSFYIPTNEPAGFGLAPGPFNAEITGFISVDLRAQFTFTAELTGRATLRVNDKEILDTASAFELETNATSAPIRLNKGANRLQIRYVSPTNVPAVFRLLWASKNSAIPIPIPPNALSHDQSPDLSRSTAIQNGAYLYQLYQCANCHAPSEKSTLFDAPSLVNAGARLDSDWIASKLLAPGEHASGRMPALLGGPTNAGDNARAISAFLSSLGSSPLTNELSKELRATGESLVKDLHCTSCHTLPGEAPASNRVSLARLDRKYLPRALLSYLQNPQAHYASNPMPDFKLTRTEAESIASFLLQQTNRASAAPTPEQISRGRELVQTAGCLNCHALDLPNGYSAPELTKIPRELTGCLDPDSTTSPRFQFTTSERSDLHAFLGSGDRDSSLSAAQFAVRSVEFLRCDQCHSDNALPSPLALGGKLKPEWSSHVIAGANTEKPRPWMKARMPGFPAYATNLAAGLAALHGYPARTQDDPPPASDLVKTGETLISANGGFSCVACHAIGANTSQVVVESPGVNLALSADRLLSPYFRRWLMNPIAIDPGTKMPLYFDAEGRSQLTEFFEGDAHKQIDAMWHYIRFLSSAK